MYATDGVNASTVTTVKRLNKKMCEAERKRRSRENETVEERQKRLKYQVEFAKKSRQNESQE